MKKKFIPFLVYSAVLATSCSVFSKRVWAWNVSSENPVVNYCLLIGQLDHNDSMERTRGVRTILDTRPNKEGQKTNYNLEEPKQGHIKLNADLKTGEPIDPTIPQLDVTINEVEHMEQKAFSGATWDPITANGSAATWISKHGKNLTFFASNNDGMAEGAIKASNWYEGMPIFGYDANTSTLKLIMQNRILGTIDSTTYGQCLATSILIRNIIEASASDKINELWKQGIKYDPTSEGFNNNPISYGTGSMQSVATLSGCDLNDENGERAILLQNHAITKDGNEEYGIMKASEFFDDNGEPLSKPDLFKKYEGPDVGGVKIDRSKFTHTSPIRVWQSWYNNADVFFTGNMNPLFTLTQSKDMFDFDVIPGEGNGADESILLNSLDSALSKPDGELPEAFLINVVKQPNAMEYINKIGKKLTDGEKDNWIERSDIPIIFWNRQPTDRYGTISTDVMNNKYFKYTYYVGFDASQGGDLQGELIRLWLNKEYLSSYAENHK